MNKKMIFSFILLTGAISLFGLSSIEIFAMPSVETVNDGVYSEDYGVVIENNKNLGYLKYKNASGKVITRSYYSGEMVVEKQPFYESEDVIGYYDEMFPCFEYDVRDTDISNLKAGDNIYLRVGQDQYIKYISAYNDYGMRYGKVHMFDKTSGVIQLSESNGRIYTYKVDPTTPATKGGKIYGLMNIKQGDWIKVLTSNHILENGGYEEKIIEVVVDNDQRILSNIYRGEFLGIDKYRELINLKNVRRFLGNDFSSYQSMMSISSNFKTLESYYLGNKVTPDYMNRYLKNSSVYVAAEKYLGKERIVKANFQNTVQKTLPITTVISVSPTEIKLLSGETLSFGTDSIIVRDNRLINPQGILVGDNIETVVTGGSKVAIAKIKNQEAVNQLQIYRGRIVKIDDMDTFEVETMSLLNNGEWFFHPTPKTFSIDASTKFFNEGGFVEEGLKTFVSYGEDSKYRKVFTVVAYGDKAAVISDMPYVKESVKGEVYSVDGSVVKLKDVYYLNGNTNKWTLYSNKNTGIELTVPSSGVVLKEGKIISVKALEPGDKIISMIPVYLKDVEGKTDAYILEVK